MRTLSNAVCDRAQPLKTKKIVELGKARAGNA